jgi:phosphoribosyl 1,2-cyclic phosphodiesterase
MKTDEKAVTDRIKFLGTAGARFVVEKQVRASGGLWLALDDTNILVDPGPGTLVKCAFSKPKLDPSTLDGIILTHKHLDHSGDINVMIEAMTEGGFKRRGEVFAPLDTLEEDPVILRYLRGFVNKIHILEEEGDYSIGKINFSTPIKHIHGVETYGIIFRTSKYIISLVVDTKFFPELLNAYSKTDVIIMNVVRAEAKGKSLEMDHLNLEDAKNIIQKIKPKLSILTHFGMTMVKAKPWEIASKLSKETGLKVIAASDGMEVKLDEESFG